MASLHTSSLSQSPPSPVPFVPSTGADTCSSSTWDEYLTTSSKVSFEFAECTLPMHVNFDDSNTAEPRGIPPLATYPAATTSSYASTSTSNGTSQSSYSTRLPLSLHHLNPVPLKLTPTNQKCQASPLLSPVSFPLTTMSPMTTTLPLTAMRPYGMKKFVRPKMHMPATPRNTQVGRWTKREHELFLEGLQRFGKSWKKISSLVHTRTLVQIRTHAQKYLQKQSRAAIKADVKTAGVATSQSQRYQQQQSTINATGRSIFQSNSPLTSAATPRQWKPLQLGDGDNSFAPLTFPNSLSSSVSTSRAVSSTSPCPTFQLNSANRLDQLLQDDNGTIPAFIDEYYTSPTAIEDGVLRPLYTSDHWLSQTETSTNYVNNRCRLEFAPPTYSEASALTALASRCALSSATFEPLTASDHLPSPNNHSPMQHQSAAAAILLAAHESDGITIHANVWP